MKRIFLLLSLGLFSLGATAAPNKPLPPAPPSPPPAEDYLYRGMNNYVANEGMFDLRQIFNIGNQYYGRQIEFVVIKARSTAGVSQATLMVNNGRNGNTQYVDGASRDYFFTPDTRGDEMDTEVGTLKMYLKGQLVLEGIGVKFSGGGYNPPPPPPPPSYRETGIVRTNIIGTGTFELDRYVDLMRYRGFRVTAVVLRASAMQIPPIPSEVSFCVARGCTQAIRLSPNTREIRVNLNERVDQGSRAWRFETRGAVAMDSFTVHFAR